LPTNQYTDQIKRFEVGQEVIVHFNLQGREWEDKNGQIKYFNSLNAWKIEDTKAEPPKDTSYNIDQIPF
jgi:hypothetical protein